MTFTVFLATSSLAAMLANNADDETAIALSCDIALICDIASFVTSGKVALDKVAFDNVAVDDVIGVEFCLLGKKAMFTSVGVFS